jgi:phenylacetate-CoA ligase
MNRLPVTIPIIGVARHLPAARAGDRLPAARVRELRDRLLRNLVRYAHDHVAYYRETLSAAAVANLRGAADLPSLPVLDRRVLNEIGAANLLADGFGDRNTRRAQTSGSSGVPVTLHYSEREMGYLRATYLWDLLACGFRPTDRIGFFRVSGFRRHRLEALGLARNVHIDTSLDPLRQTDAFLAGRPTFLRGFPNGIASVVVELKRRGVRYDGVRVVVFGGEGLADAARAEVLDYFGARGHEVYASVEAYTIARSCPLGSLHLRSADVVVEVEHDDGTVSLEQGEGEILVTRLRAEAMPLLRYRLGDRVLITPNDCLCGVRHTPIVKRIQGRVEDQITALDGRTRNGDFLASLLGQVEDIRQYQFVQRRPGAVEVVLVPADGGADGLVERVRAALSPATRDFEIEVRITGAITPERNGKIRLVKRVND